ncbi:MAG: hypothetical protein JNK04_15905 [Myxococcales bacterium]|nr:hypothetical protein [Myxococcales bacterium]
MKDVYAVALLAAMLAGCGPTVGTVCEDLQSACPEVGSDCEDDGEDLEEMASDAGCDELFDMYLDCLSNASCDWRGECGVARSDLAECVGGFPE